MATAIPKGLFWINPKDRTVTVFGSGNQRVSMSAISMVGRATVAVLSNPDAYINRPSYFADFSVTTNELFKLVEEITAPEKWTAVNVPLDTFYENGKRLWDEDTANGVQTRLYTKAYVTLGTYGLFEEHNRYGADFAELAEKGWLKPLGLLKEQLRAIIEAN